MKKKARKRRKKRKQRDEKWEDEIEEGKNTYLEEASTETIA